jgi:hypothetical protein
MSKKPNDKVLGIRLTAQARKLQTAQQDLDDHQLIAGVYEQDFQRVIRIAAGNIRSKHNPEILQKNIEEAKAKSAEEENIDEDDNEINPTLKNLHRRIALLTHPDRLVSETSAAEKERKEALFKRAAKAYDDQDLCELVLIASELKIAVEDFVDAQTLMMAYDEKISAIQKKVKSIKESYVWIWGESHGNLDMRVRLLDIYLQQTGHAKVDEQILRDIVAHHEEPTDVRNISVRQRETGTRPKRLIR